MSFQANVLTVLENWCSQAKRGKRGQKDDLLRSVSVWEKWHHTQLDWPARREVVAQSGRAGSCHPAAPSLPPQASTEMLSLWEKLPVLCPAQAFCFMGPDWLSQPHHLRPSLSLGIKKWTHGVAPYPCLTLVYLCRHSGLRGLGQTKSMARNPWLSTGRTGKCRSLAQLKSAKRLHLASWGFSGPL